MSAKLTAAEEQIMKATFRATMLRAANVVSKIKQSDVEEMQARLIAEGGTLEDAARIDRASVAAAWLRLCAEGKANLDA